MRENRFAEITSKYGDLTIALIGDFCLDRYFEIDPQIQAISIETGRPVHAVAKIRNHAGGAGTILNNLAALGVKTIFPLGLAGDDGEGFELRRALQQQRGVSLKYFQTATNRITPTYLKPLIIEGGKSPTELNRFDLGMTKPIEPETEARLASAASDLFKNERLDAVILLEQFDVPEASVISQNLLYRVEQLAVSRPELTIIGDSRGGLRDWPLMIYKMNLAELGLLTDRNVCDSHEGWTAALHEIANRTGRQVIVTRGNQGMTGISGNEIYSVPAFPVRGAIDIVGAGDCVTANIAASLASGADLGESLQIASAAASIVIHQLGVTGTATVNQIKELLRFDP